MGVERYYYKSYLCIRYCIATRAWPSNWTFPSIYLFKIWPRSFKSPLFSLHWLVGPPENKFINWSHVIWGRTYRCLQYKTLWQQLLVPWWRPAPTVCHCSACRSIQSRHSCSWRWINKEIEITRPTRYLLDPRILAISVENLWGVISLYKWLTFSLL